MFGELMALGLTEKEAALFNLYVSKMNSHRKVIAYRFWKDLSMDEADLEDLIYGLYNLNK